MTGQYDLDRAARAGGFDDDMDTGRNVARILHRTIRRWGTEVIPIVPQALISDVVNGVAGGLYDDDPTSNTLWLAATHNEVAHMYRDLIEQTREVKAKEAS